MDTKLLHAYKRSYYSGQSKVARIIDAVLLPVIVFAGVYLIIRQRFSTTQITAICAAMITIVIVALQKTITKLRLKKHIVRLRTASKHAIMEARLSVMADDAYCMLISKAHPAPHYIIRKVEPLDRDDVFAAYRYAHASSLTCIDIIANSKLTAIAEQLISELSGVRITHRMAIDILSKSDYVKIQPSEEEIDTFIIDRHSKKPFASSIGTRFKDALMPVRSKQYLITGGLLMLLSYFMRYGVFMRLIASIALSLAAFSYVSDVYSAVKHSATTSGKR